MSPGQQAIQVSDLCIEFVVSLRTDCNNAVRANHSNIGCHVENAAVGYLLAVPDVHERQFALRDDVNKDSGDDQGAKIVSLARFIDADAFDGAVRCLVVHRQVALVEILNEAR
jgi:hypothetical protein